MKDSRRIRRIALPTGSRAFTLFEVMITVAIIAILAAIAWPSYAAYVVRANRSAAQQFMSSLASREEQILLDLRQFIAVTANANFPNAPTAGSPGLNVTVPNEVVNLYDFTITIAAGPPPTYLIKGAPVAGKMQANDKILYLNSAGEKWRDYDGNTTFNAGTDVDWNSR